MLELRATPVDSKLPSPAEMLMGRPTTTLLPSRTSPSPVTVAQREHLDRRQSTVKSNYDRHAGESLPPLDKGQNVMVLDKASRTWIPGEVTGHSGEPRSYNVRTNQGSNIRRNRGDSREAPQQDCADTGNRPGVKTQIHARPTPLETPSAIRLEHDPTTDREAERPSQSGQETVRTCSVGWSEPLPVKMNTPVEQDYHTEHGKATANKLVNDYTNHLLFLHLGYTWS